MSTYCTLPALQTAAGCVEVQVHERHVQHSCRARCLQVVWRRYGSRFHVFFVFSHQARGGTDGRGGTTVTEGNMRVSRCYHWPLRRTPLWAAKSLDWPLHLVPLTPLTTSVILIGGPSAKTRERGWAQPQSREPIRRQRTELEKKLNITALLWRHSLRDTYFFCQSSHPYVSPQRLTKWPRKRTSVFGAGARSGLVIERCDNTSVQKQNGALHSCPLTTYRMDTRDSRRPQLSNTAWGFSFLFSQLFFPSKQGRRSNWDNILQDAFTVAEVRLLQRFDGETVTSLDQPVVEGWRVRGVPWWGSAGFQDCSGKDCLKLKDSSRREIDEGRKRRVSSPSGDENDKNKANNLSACLLGSWWWQPLCLSQPLLKSYFTFGWIYFCVKKKRLCKGSCQLQ